MTGWVRWLGLLFIIAGCATLESGGAFLSGRQALMRGDTATALSYFEQIANHDPNYVSPFPSFKESIWTYLGRAQYESGKLVDAKGSLERALSQIPDDSVAKLYLGLTNVRRQTTEKVTDPFTLQDITFALRERIEPKRVAVLAHERGIAFDLTAESERQLKKAGADDFLLNEIKKIRGESIKRREASESQLREARKELAAAFAGIREQLDYLDSTATGIFWDPDKQIRSQTQTALSLLSAPQPDWQKILSTGEWVGQKLEEEISLAPLAEEREMRRQEMP